jgi:sugar phosphate isomerase/epimerase
MDPDRSRLLANLSELSKLAEQYRIVVALELISYSSIGTVADLATVVRALGPNVVPLVDSLQFFRSGANAAEAAILSTARYLQISDGPREGPSTFEGLRREARTDRLLPGKGDFDLVGLLRVLPQGIPIAVEAPGKIVSSLPLHEAAALLHHATLDVARRAFDPGRASDDLE